MPLEFAEIKDAPVTLQVKEASLLEAATAVCKAAGLGYGVGIGKGAKDAAVWFKLTTMWRLPSFSGHFAVEVVSVTLSRSTRVESTCSLHLRLLWPPGVSPDLGLLNVSSIFDDKGNILFDQPERAAFGNYDYDGMNPGQVRFSTSTRVGFKHPPDDVEKIGTIRGSALIVFAGEDRFITFEASEKNFGRKRAIGGVSAELRGIKVDGNVTTVTYAQEGWPAQALPNWRTPPRGLGGGVGFRLEDGTIAVSNHGGTRMEGPVRVEELRFTNLSSKIATVEILAETAFHREKFDFELKDIPLPK